MNEADDLIALYRVNARETPDAGLDAAIIAEAQIATRRRQRMPAFAACAAALAVLAGLTVLHTAPTPVSPAANGRSSYGLREGSARMLLLDPQRLHDTALQQRPGMNEGL